MWCGPVSELRGNNAVESEETVELSSQMLSHKLQVYDSRGRKHILNFRALDNRLDFVESPLSPCYLSVRSVLLRSARI
jgi:hypothetical protein